VKKNKSKARKPLHKNKQSRNTQPLGLQQSISIQQKYWPVLRIIKWICASSLSVFFVVMSIYGLLGPPWPTAPSFSPGIPSIGSPFDIPFTVTNKSVTFPINELVITCNLNDVKTNASTISNISVRVTAKNVLEAGLSAPYTCPFGSFFVGYPFGKIIYAQITFSSE
jgi:hypothetical protein